MTDTTMIQTTGRLLAIMVATFTVELLGDPYDGLQFKMDFRAEQTAIAANTVGNAVDLGKPSRTSGGNKESRKVQQTNVDSPDSVYPWRINEECALDFPQYTTDADGTLRIDPVAMLFTEDAVTSDTQTVYIRFCWEGSAVPASGHHSWLIMNGYDYSTKGYKGSTGVGWALSLYNPVGAVDYGYLGWLVPRASGTIADWGSPYTAEGSIYRIATNVWYDLFATIEPSPSDSAKTLISFRLAQAVATNAKPSWRQSFSVTADATLDFSSAKQVIRLGSESVALGWDPLPAAATQNDGIYMKSFRGKISRVMIWNRILADAEKWEVLAGAHGADWRIGIANGSADEFAAADSATASDEVWGMSNTWSVVRRELTEDHPSLTIKDEIPTCEEGVGKILVVKPILSGATSFPVELRVNGDTVGEFDLASSFERAMLVPEAVWRNGANGYASLQLVRKPPFTGTLAIDAIELSGGWVMNDLGSMANPELNLYSPYHIGLRDTRAIKGGASVWSSSYAYFWSQSIVADIPEEAFGRFVYRLSVTVPNASKADLPHSFHVNGHRFAEFTSVPIGATLTAQIPQEYLTVGQNTLVVSNGANNCWCNWTYRIDVKKLRGTVLVIR